jgi:hypothetical protein
METLRVKNLELVEVLITSKDRSTSVLVNYLLTKYKLSEDCESSLTEAIRKTILPKFNQRWARSHRNKTQFLTNNEFWLNECYFEWSPDSHLVDSFSSCEEQPCSSRGRPEKDF